MKAFKVITERDEDQPVSEIRPLEPEAAKARRPFGLARGAFVVPPDFGAQDPEIERMFYGETK